MTQPRGSIERRTLLKLMGAAGASAAVTQAAGRLGAPLAVRAAGAMQDDIEPFEFHVGDAELEDLGRRLASPRWPGEAPGEPWSYGTDREYLQELVAYWRDQYDWRAHEAELNSFDHYTTTIDGQRLHFVHHKGQGPDPMPLVMTHGWPGTIWEMLPSVRALSDPAATGGTAADRFDVVVPSIPGFGFSGAPIEGTDAARTAELWVALMEKLGYQKFGAYGSDWGSLVTRQLGARFPDSLFGVITPGAPPLEQRQPETAEEREFLEAARLWSVEETADPRDETSDACLWAHRLCCGSRRMDHGEAQGVERLPW